MTTGKNARPFAVFDIDGTLLRWQLYHALADELVKNGLFDQKAYRAIRQARLTWKERAHADSYSDYEAALVKYFEQSVIGLPASMFNLAVGAVIDVYKDQVYTYTRGLIRDLKNRNYLLFAISASQDQIVQLLAERYGFDAAIGSEYEIVDGKFTGERKIMRGEAKIKALEKLANKHGASSKNSIGVGDSESDIPMLEFVDQPIAFNPTSSLFEHAKQKSWAVVLERKNQVYKMELSRGKYQVK